MNKTYACLTQTFLFLKGTSAVCRSFPLRHLPIDFLFVILHVPNLNFPPVFNHAWFQALFDSEIDSISILHVVDHS